MRYRQNCEIDYILIVNSFHDLFIESRIYVWIGEEINLCGSGGESSTIKCIFL